MEIDAVVTWVDGADPVHIAARNLHKPPSEPGSELDIATKNRRFSDNGELRHCLRSLHNHASWLRRVWLVTDKQTPAFLDVGAARAHGLEIVDHRRLFRDHDALLPTFNSLSIETFLWRIEGLADRFLYLNDDMMLTGPVEPSDFFTADGRTVLRGRWADASAKTELGFHEENKLRGVDRAGGDRAHYFSPGHAVYPMRVAPLAEAYAADAQAFVENARPRFRDRSQWWPVSYDHHRLIAEDGVETREPKDVVHLSVGETAKAEPKHLAWKLWTLRKPHVKMTCLNFMEELERKVPDVLDRLGAVTGSAAPWEKV